jgi:hypothetical protein
VIIPTIARQRGSIAAAFPPDGAAVARLPPSRTDACGRLLRFQGGFRVLLSTQPLPATEHSFAGAESPSLPRRRALVVIRWPLGGIRTYVLYLSPHLLRAGYRFTFVGPADASFRSFCAELRDWPDVEFIEAPQHRHRCWLRPTVRQALREYRYDLIHSHGFTAAAEAVLGNFGLGVPHVVTSHDVFRADQVAGLRGTVKRWLLGLILARTDCVVSVSHDAQDNLVRYLPGWLTPDDSSPFSQN